MRTKSVIIAAAGFLLGQATWAQTEKIQQDKAAIIKMCGCFEVTFNFAETFNYTNDSPYKPSDNKVSKVIRKAGEEDVLLAKEKGYNTYVRVDDSRCRAAADWWQENEAKWALVRAKWDNIFARKQDLSLEAKVDNKELFKYLSEDGYEEAAAIDGVIESFLKNSR